MRGLIGSLVLIAGVIGLGAWGAADHASRIEGKVSQATDDILDGAPHVLASRVSGRDVTVTGRVTDQAEWDALQADLLGIEGLRRLDMSAVQLLPVADPFEITIAKTEDAWTAEGVVPSEAARRTFEVATGELFPDLDLAAGAPTGWVDVGTVAIGQLDQMGAGLVVLSGETVTVSGVVDTPADRASILAALEQAGAFTIINDIDTRDDGRPFALRVTFNDGQVRALGKVPQDWPMGALVTRFERNDGIRLEQSVLAASQPDWVNVAEAGLDALTLLIEGTVVLEGSALTLAGEGSPDGIEAAAKRLAALDTDMTVEAELSVFGADRPLVLSMNWDGQQAEASGTFPAEFTPRGPQGTAVINSGEVMFLPDEKGAFTANANAGVAALGLLQTGILTATETEIVLAGTATSPQVEDTITAVLANAAPDTAVSTDLTFLDDGSPASWRLTYDAIEGAEVEGRLPLGVGPDEIGAALGVPVGLGSTTTALEDESAGSSPAVLAAVAVYFPEIETLSMTQGASGVGLDLVMSPGVQIDLVAQTLAETLPVDVAFSISPLDPLPANGTLRVNAATGLSEVFVNGFWIPELDFGTTLAGCTEASAGVLSGGSVSFLSGSARLDATSIRAINALAAVAVPCVEADLELEVSGHTDASGDAEQNQVLSQERAEAVRAALIARGVPQRAITAIGFGDSQPVADNETVEGRALNRRTDIVWFERGALRDP